MTTEFFQNEMKRIYKALGYCLGELECAVNILAWEEEKLVTKELARELRAYNRKLAHGAAEV